MEIAFKEISTKLDSRLSGLSARHRIEYALSNNSELVLNFEGVNHMSKVFADECFGKLVLESPSTQIKVGTIKKANTLIRVLIANSIKAKTKI